VLATIAFIGVGVAIAQMVIPEPDGTEASAASLAPTATATPAKKHKTAKKKKAKPKGPTKAERESTKAAVAIVRQKGFTTLKQSDYDPKATFRVLIGRPVGDSAGGNRAFFFMKDTFLGNDALSPSTKLTVARTGKVTVTLSYGVYESGDPAGQPSARKKVRFRLEGTRIHALEGLVESDWTTATFTMNWKLTRPGEVVFEQDEPFCMVIPQRRHDLESFSPAIRPVGDDAGAEAGWDAFTTARQAMLRRKFLSQYTEALADTREAWEGDYFRGRTADGREAPEHKTKKRLKPF